MSDDERVGPPDRIEIRRDQELGERLLSWFPEDEYPTIQSEQDAWLRLYELCLEQRGE